MRRTFQPVRTSPNCRSFKMFLNMLCMEMRLFQIPCSSFFFKLFIQIPSFSNSFFKFVFRFLPQVPFASSFLLFVFQGPSSSSFFKFILQFASSNSFLNFHLKLFLQVSSPSSFSREQIVFRTRIYASTLIEAFTRASMQKLKPS